MRSQVMENKIKGNKIMRKKVIVIVGIMVLLIGILGAAQYWSQVNSLTKSWTNLVYPNVTIEDINVSGKTMEEAKAIIKLKYGDEILKKNITIKTPVKSYSIDYIKLNAKYNIDEVVKEAFDYGKSLDTYEKYKLLKNKNPESKKLTLRFDYDKNPVKDLIATMKKEIDKTPVDGSITLTGGKFQIVPDLKGIKFVDDNLEKDITDKINGDLKSPNIIVEAKIETVLANITKEKLETIDTVLSSFTTNFSTSSWERSTNITLATKSISGKLMMPGDSFSFNGIVGQRTAAKGYQPAPVDIGTKVALDYGGGICQVSTTLYNAVIRANIKSTDRNNHSIPSTYIGFGMDATVDWGNLDYKFTNTLAFPIFIEGIIQNKVLTFNVYCNSSLKNRSYNLVNEVVSTTEPGPTKYIDDNSLPTGETVQEQFPIVGRKVRVYKDTIENGNIIAHELLYTDSNVATAEIIRRGTKTP